MISAGKRNLLVQWCCMYLSPLAVLYTNRIHILFLLFVLQKELEKYKKDNGHCRMPRIPWTMGNAAALFVQKVQE
jgi:hypothetical protein